MARKNAVDITGQRFGRLYVESFMGHDVNGRAKYRCKCDCGKQSIVRRDLLLRGTTSSCGNCSWIESEDSHYRYHCHSGGSFIFDGCDLDLVSGHRWLINKNGYVRGTSDGKLVTFTRVVLNAKTGEFVDHINGDKLDNRRCNLRIASPTENSRNRRLSVRNTSGYKGVYSECRNRSNPWRASIIVNHKKKNLGSYDTAIKAALAYDDAARYYFGKFAKVNFPRVDEQGCLEGAS